MVHPDGHAGRIGHTGNVSPLRRSGESATSLGGRISRGRRVPPIVLVALTHPLMCRWTRDLLATQKGCWTTVAREPGEMVVTAMERTYPDVVVVDSLDFPACCRAALDALPPERVIVIGPEPDGAYRKAALAQGAGGWVSRDHLGGDLSTALWELVGCGHQACPHRPAPGRAHASPPRPRLPHPGSSQIP